MKSETGKRFFSLIAFFLASGIFVPTHSADFFSRRREPEELKIFRAAYPDIEFISAYDKEKDDWLIRVVKNVGDNSKSEVSLYWCGCRFLPEEKIGNQDDYRRMLYRYSPEVPDPDGFSDEDVERIKSFSSPENRAKSPVDPPFLYNFIYDCGSRESLEKHIVSAEFLGFALNVHERIVPVLEKVEKKINSLPETQELKNFKEALTRVDCYNWRTVRDTENRSFHSVGIAVDVLPRGYYQKSIYWNWQRQWNPDTWWKTPLSSRWMPPEEVRKAFLSEGFIWGGSWIVWDNMHFEYRPELLRN